MAAGRSLSAPRRAARCVRARVLEPRVAPAKALKPVTDTVSAFGPPTVANLGPGFDFLGCAVEGAGDVVTVTARPDLAPNEILIESIEGDGGRLSLEPDDNCCGIAARETLKLIGGAEVGVSLTLNKGLPLGSGLGSSAASAAAAAVAVNDLFGSPLSREALVPAGLASEAYVSGYHADNIAPAIMGGFVLVRGYEPELSLQALAFPGEDLWFAIVTPKFEAPTREMRAVIPAEVPFKAHVNNSIAGATLVASVLSGDTAELGRALNSDGIVEPARGPVIPGFAAVKAAALDAGAYGATISGAGPTVVAVASSAEQGRVAAEAMVAAFGTAGNLEVERALVVPLCKDGARACDPGEGCVSPLVEVVV